jgi:peptidoglycan/xylan/chitin deacetylase (PgdA/CDA1 family)
MTPPVPVLMYHSITDEPTPATRRLSVAPSAFAAQLEMLDHLGFTTLPFTEVAEASATGRRLPERVVALTFDDGYADFHSTALPLLREHGATATVFVTTGWLDDAGEEAAGQPLDAMLRWDQVREIADAGIEVGAHSHSHPQLDQLAGTALAEELAHSRCLLEERVGMPVRTLAYPYGYSSRRVRKAVEVTGYRSAAAVTNAAAGGRHDPLAVPRLTVRRATDLETFRRILRTEGLRRVYLVDRTLTRGYAVVRRTKSVLRRPGRDD